jgi:metal-sulfur cluster biosynthetic enzyme
MSSSEELSAAILDKLSGIIDPETGADVVRMQLIENLKVDPSGRVSYTLRPSSLLCPIAFFLAVQIKLAVAEIAGVTAQKIRVIDYIEAEKLTELINQEKLFDLEGVQSQNGPP